MLPLTITFGVLLFAPFVEQPNSTDVEQPVGIIFDTDLGNDCDDVLALGMIHALQSRGECELLAVTITKDHPDAAKFAACVNHFYGRGAIPIGVCDSNVTPEAGKYNRLANQLDDGVQRYPNDLGEAAAQPAVALLRQTLSSLGERRICVVQVGFSTNLANLLRSGPDEISVMTGKELIERNVSLLSMMAGAFSKIPNAEGELYDHREYNIIKDIPAAQTIASSWPTPIVWSGFEIGIALPYPHQSILNDFNYVTHHPLAEAYTLYNPPPHDRPTWDLTSVLYAVRPTADYFELSGPGRVSVAEDGLTDFEIDSSGRHQYLILDPQQKPRILEALTLLSSQPPTR